MVFPGYSGDTKEDKNEGLADTAPHLQEILDSGMGLMGDVGLHIRTHNHAGGNQPAREEEMCYRKPQKPQNRQLIYFF